jgi:GTP-binding protein Era
VLVDTPGLHDAWTPMNRAMVAAADRALQDVDAVAWILDVVGLVERAGLGEPVLDEGLGAIHAKLAAQRAPLVIVLNKVDLVERPRLLPVLDALASIAVPLVPISARKRHGLDRLVEVLAGLLPERPAAWPEDQLTDATERFIVTEIVRERIFELCHEEVPYAAAVEIERFDESARDAGRVHIHARILVEKDSQKAILIGAGGAMIKRIGTGARRRIAGLLGCRVRLDLFVAVERDWTHNPRLLRDLGLGGG